ncbi:MAG: glycogen debranching enzyme N-terminal domain-containing protein, partial [Candidatus Micrarchaeota archaeon]|nr:glycogen debranching enzyme N-terminal domain-containing protein [Candidatus Micrarchaeota archaeon]
MPSLSAFDLVPSEAAKHEWLLASGTGAYSSSTAIGMNTRKYHGLLIAPLRGCNSRHVMLSKFEETVKISNSEFPLSTNAYPGAIYPHGYKHQVGFAFADHPVFSYSLNGTRIEKSVRIVRGHDAVVVSYRLVAGREAEIVIRPMLSPRSIHADPSSAGAALQFESDRFGFEIKKPAKMRVSASFGKFTAAPQKYNNMEYVTERARGYPGTETLFSPGAFTATLSKNDELHIASSLAVPDFLAPSEALEILDRQLFKSAHYAGEYARTNGIDRTDFSDTLIAAAESFIRMRGSHRGIGAGFHWFSEWGRDTMVSIPGLLLCTGRAGLAREMLLEHSHKMKDGLLPNFIDENGEPHYNSSDAALFFINTLREYAETTLDYYTIQKQFWKTMKAHLSATIDGNSLISMDHDCLLRVSDPSSTWMDARVGGKAVTPRKGKPVEINALWNSNLHFMRELAIRFDDRRTNDLCSQLIENYATSFQDFLSADGEGGLLDLLEPNDATLRPNQLFAISLPNSPLNPLQQRHIFNAVRSKLYTPLGMRTLATDDPNFHAEYKGSENERNAAYHQGAIWPWLLGAFYDAQLRVNPGSEHTVLASLRP